EWEAVGVTSIGIRGRNSICDKLLDPTCVPGYYTIPSVNRDGDEFSEAFLGKSKKTISSKKESPHKEEDDTNYEQEREAVDVFDSSMNMYVSDFNRPNAFESKAYYLYKQLEDVFLGVTLRQNQFAKKQKGLLNLISISKLKLRTLLKKRLKSCIAVLFEMPKSARLEAKKEEILNREIEVKFIFFPV
ncbi:hypothetical protein Tco_0753552, partial [Tanacetum coccineum]